MQLLLSCLLVVFHVAASARILTILPLPVKSHGILFDRLLHELADRGHQVTFITPFESVNKHANITEIFVPNQEETMTRGYHDPYMLFSFLPAWVLLATTIYGSYSLNQVRLNTPSVQELLYSEPFDLIIGEPWMDESMLAGFAYKHKAAIAMLSAMMPNMWSNYMSGNAAPASYVPDTLVPYSPQMTFGQRFTNLIYGLFGETVQRLNLYLQDRLMRRHFGENLPYIDDILRRTSLLLVNNHFTINFPRPQLPNTVDVAGMHIYPPKPLPKDLEEFMNSSKDGVILFSLGTYVNSCNLPKETVEGITRALGRLPGNVLWKFEAELENLPKNVKIAKWWPQSDILAHPNTRLFITHGGALSTIEAAYQGVPMVGIPVFFDQPNNMKLNEEAGLAITVPIRELTEETLYNAAIEVLENPKYRVAAKLRSELFQDTLVPPLESAVWWIEYVLRHKGAPHLRSASQDLYWFQLYQIDTIFTLIVLIIFILSLSTWIMVKIFRSIFRLKCNNNSSIKEKKL